MPENQESCRNCGTPLTGEFCSECGQREGRGDVHLGEVAGELADDFLHWDSRIWRTLFPLLFRPGFLTAEFIAGRKARYVPAFRLYLIISFLLFLVLSLNPATVSVGSSHAPGEDVAETDSPATEGEEGTAFDITFDFRPKRPEDIAAAEEEGETVIAPFAIGGDDRVAVDEKITIGVSDEDSPQWLIDLDKRMSDNADRIAEDPNEFLARLVEYLPQTMFLLLPLFALLLKLCYLFSPFHYLQHLVFSMHSHSFVFLITAIGELLELALPVSLGWVRFLLVMLYLPVALRRVYGSGVFGAVGKSLFIVAVDSVLLVLGFAAAAVVALALM
jgi:hypothetical protein